MVLLSMCSCLHSIHGMQAAVLVEPFIVLWPIKVFISECHSLIEVLHCDRKLFLVFEYLDYDLKKYMDKRAPSGIPHDHVKVTEEPWCVCLSVLYVHECCGWGKQ